MRRAPVLFFALSTALLAACGVSLEQASVAPVAPAVVEAPEPAAQLPAEGDGRHAYLHRVGGHDYVSLSQCGPQGGLPIQTGMRRHARDISMLDTDSANALP